MRSARAERDAASLSTGRRLDEARTVVPRDAHLGPGAGLPVPRVSDRCEPGQESCPSASLNPQAANSSMPCAPCPHPVPSSHPQMTPLPTPHLITRSQDQRPLPQLPFPSPPGLPVLLPLTGSLLLSLSLRTLSGRGLCPVDAPPTWALNKGWPQA